jgi:hypothetical protein
LQDVAESNFVAEPNCAQRVKAYVNPCGSSLNRPSKDLSQGGAQELPQGYEVLERGLYCDVLIKASVRERIVKKASEEQRVGLKDLAERYARGGLGAMTRNKFNTDEGWFPSKKDKRVRLQAFKPWQFRAYGFEGQIHGRRTFFITGADWSKKQDRANQTILAGAGDEAVRLYDEIKAIGGSHASRSH